MTRLLLTGSPRQSMLRTDVRLVSEEIKRMRERSEGLILNQPGHPLVKLGLTCFHLVANDLVGQREIEYPDALDLNNSIKKLEDLSAKPNCLPETTNTSNKLRLRARNPPIRQVVATSGRRLKAAGRRMDWALLTQVVGDKTKNYPPSPAKLHSVAFPEGGAGYYKVTPGSLISQFGTIKKDYWLIKNGRTTQITTRYGMDSVLGKRRH